MTKQTAKKATSKTSTKKSPKSNSKATKPEIDLPAPERVIRHELLGVWDFLLVDPGERLPAAARQALFDSLKGSGALCVVQCAGYVFNLTTLPYITFMDAGGEVTDSSAPASDKTTPNT